MLSPKPADWFRAVYLAIGARDRARKVIADYAAIGARHPEFLVDVALRGGVYRAHDPRTDGSLEHFNGRRELALELIKLARLDATALYDLLPEAPRGGAKL